MQYTEVPLSIKKLGTRFIGYILNLDVDAVEAFFAGALDLGSMRAEVLLHLIDIYRSLRLQLIDHDEVEFVTTLSLPQLVENDRHIFNIWRERVGGEIYAPITQDPVTGVTASLAIEAYPLFLLTCHESREPFTSVLFLLNSLLFRLKKHDNLLNLLKEDSSISKLFVEEEQEVGGRRGRYMASSGRGGDIQLEMLPATLITNSYQLMTMRGEVSQRALATCVGQVVNMVREAAEGRVVQVPAYTGLHNVGITGFENIDLHWGRIFPYNKDIAALIPSEARPPLLGDTGTYLGIVLETSCPYKVDFGHTAPRWPRELQQARENLMVLQENFSLLLALAIDRTPPIGLAVAWTMVVDPLCQGINVSFNYAFNPPVPYYLIQNADIPILKDWGKIISDSDDHAIRIAIRRLLSAVNQRINPVDGFVDAIVAWENLFGGNAELGFRISVAISKLLGNNDMEKRELQKKVVGFYNDRSKIVHGVKDITREEAIHKRNECVIIGLRCIRKLYLEHKDLLTDLERSKTLALQ